ncbi:pentatricopeptide repeat-containing protein At3g24000, mitochondrial [Neltuma alba]|uniref:pentatricopeptide repeat-containing protein At3g24000, mitochondrial n=1 Tax=Neltuma alba TaxID=207710 RepID=UPI0010A391D0|nr:pentatricopeptide repeat-containing protein At3g24000, mitochondrial [Prosopis alba]
MIRCKTLASVLKFSVDLRTLLANSAKLARWHSSSLLRPETPETCIDSDVLPDGKRDNLYIVDDNNLLCPSLKSKTGLYVLDLMDSGSIEVDRTLYNKLLKRCTQLGRLELGRLVHSHILGSKFRDDIVIQNSVIYMYARCKNLEDARKVFDKMTSKDMVTWTSLITGYAQNERAEDALVLFPQMLRDGLKPNEFTLSSVVKSAALLPSYRDGRQIHACCLKHGCHFNVYVGSSLVDMYARCGYLSEARQIFDKLVNKNEVSWNALIAGYARKDEGEEALSLFLKMQREGFKPTEFTYSSLFCSCSALGSLEQGKWLHAHMMKSGRKLVGFAGNTLLHMYAKAGSIEDAEKVFAQLVKVDLVSWNSMLFGYAQHGLGKEAVQEFEEMIRVGFEPNDISFLCVLTACSRAGLLNDGKYYFKLMNKYKVEPKVSHYVTMVDLLGRAGFLDEAKRFIEEEMPIEPTAAIWGALLGASKMHKNLGMGAYAAERIFELDPSDSGPHILLANMYASAGRWSDAARIRKVMRESGVKKEPACSWVEIGNSVHIFVADDNAHPQKEKIHEMWEELSQKIKEIGYVPDTSHVLLFVDQQEKEAKLQYHSEKLALAFALLNTYPGSTIRIMKNIRVCGDCHSAIKYVSRVVKREIILRDKNRFHHFRDGSCSCGDYW